MRPTERFTRVCRIIDADHAERSTSSQERAFVAAATSSSIAARDATIAWAAQTRERTDFLIDSYHDAPEADRPAAATLAAATLMLGAAHSLGASPEHLRRDLDTATPAALTRADAALLGIRAVSAPDPAAPGRRPVTSASDPDKSHRSDRYRRTGFGALPSSGGG